MNKTEGVNMFIVTGRTGHSLVAAKALPFAVLEKVSSIYIFSETKGFDIPKCTYVTVPGWIRKTRPAFLGKTIRFFFEPLQLLYFSIKLKPDFINGVYCLPKGLNSYIVSRLSGVKCVNSVIGSILEIETELPLKAFWRKINLWHLRGCEVITIKGDKEKQYLLSKGFDPMKMLPFNGAVDTKKFAHSNSVREIDILYVGSFIELKGPFRIISIAERVMAKYPDIRIVLVGDGPMLQRTEVMTRELGITKNFTFEGYRKETVKYFQESKILLMPSRSEGLPTSMLEAMSCGCVPVISDVGNVREAAIDNVTAKLISDFNDIDSYVKAIFDLLGNDKKLKKLAGNGRKMVEDNYSIDSQSAKANNIINMLNIS